MSYVGWPRTPQPEIGRTVPHEVKRIVVYISPAAAKFNQRLKWTLVISGSIVVVCLIFSGELNRIMNPPKPPLPPII
jgi:tRNA G37 N-methylase TrmD